MALEKKDFIEIEFTGKVKDGEIFDSNVEEVLKKVSSQADKIKPKPFIFSLGEGMFLPAIDDFLIGKPETPADYNIELPPEKAFGVRNQLLIQKVPIQIFQQHKLNPIPGYVFNFDGRVGKVLASTGGRVTVDFNHPLAGKNVIYEIKLLRKVEDLNEKIKSFIDFLFRRELPFEIQQNKLLIEVEKQLKDFVFLFKDKFNDVFGLELEVREKVEEAGKEAKELEEEVLDKTNSG